MSIDIGYVADGEGIVLKGSGLVTGRDIIEANQEIYRPDSLKKQKYQIFDFSTVDRFDVTSADIRRCAEQDKAASTINPHIAIAIIVAKDAEYGMARMWEAHVADSGCRTMIFRDRETAEDWIKSLIDRS